MRRFDQTLRKVVSRAQVDPERRRMRLALVVAANIMLGGCRTLAPDYARPVMPVADTFPDAGAVGGRAASDIPWREFFGDSMLKSLMVMALEHNRNLRKAVLDVERARAPSGFSNRTYSRR